MLSGIRMIQWPNLDKLHVETSPKKKFMAPLLVVQTDGRTGATLNTTSFHGGDIKMALT